MCLLVSNTRFTTIRSVLHIYCNLHLQSFCTRIQSRHTTLYRRVKLSSFSRLPNHLSSICAGQLTTHKQFYTTLSMANDNDTDKYPTALQFLQHCHSIIQYINQHNKLPYNLKSLNIVIGNEASDLDSMVSALITAYYYSAITIQQCIQQQNIDTITIPICNIRREEFIYRGEATYAFSKANITVDDLLFNNTDINLQQYQQTLKQQLGIILVDHNKLAERQTYLLDNIVGIYDHHVDSKKSAGIQTRIIEPVGSCVTLPTSEIIQQQPQLLHQYSNKGLCELIECVILLDTDNLSTETKKATQKDIDVLQWLDTTIRKSEYKLLKQLRSDVSKLTTIQLLNRDTKFSMNTTAPNAIASLPISLQTLQQQDSNYIHACEQFCTDHKLAFLIVLTSYSDKQKGKHARQLLVYVPESNKQNTNKSPKQLYDYIINNLESSGDTLQLERIQHPPPIQGQVNVEMKNQPQTSQHVVAYNQLNLAASRKQVLPLVDSIISKL